MITAHYFKTLGFLSKKFSDEQLKPLKDEIDYILRTGDAEPHHMSLAGNLKKEYLLTSSHKCIEELVLPLINEYEKQFDYFSSISVNTKDRPVILENAWVNFQEKYEYNPAHNHNGIMSFVIWMNIPFSTNEESKVFPGTKHTAKNGSFTFLYTNTNGQIQAHPIVLDSNYENVCVVFPSTMMHCVYPFYTSDSYRVSVSGNFKITV